MHFSNQKVNCKTQESGTVVTNIYRAIFSNAHPFRQVIGIVFIDNIFSLLDVMEVMKNATARGFKRQQ